MITKSRSLISSPNLDSVRSAFVNDTVSTLRHPVASPVLARHQGRLLFLAPCGGSRTRFINDQPLQAFANSRNVYEFPCRICGCAGRHPFQTVGRCTMSRDRGGTLQPQHPVMGIFCMNRICDLRLLVSQVLDVRQECGGSRGRRR